MGFIIRMLITALGLWLAARLVPGVRIDGGATLLLASLLLGVVNAFVRPVVVFLTFPITLVTLGLFLWVINAAMFGLVAWFLSSFQVAGLGSALLGAAIVSVTGWIGSSFVGPSGRYELLVVRQERARLE
jgi:putative membrane protein